MVLRNLLDGHDQTKQTRIKQNKSKRNMHTYNTQNTTITTTKKDIYREKMRPEN